MARKPKKLKRKAPEPVPKWQVEFLRTGKFSETAEDEAEHGFWSLDSFEQNFQNMQLEAWQRLKAVLLKEELEKFSAYHKWEGSNVDLV